MVESAEEDEQGLRGSEGCRAESVPACRAGAAGTAQGVTWERWDQGVSVPRPGSAADVALKAEQKGFHCRMPLAVRLTHVCDHSTGLPDTVPPPRHRCVL